MLAPTDHGSATPIPSVRPGARPFDASRLPPTGGPALAFLPAAAAGVVVLARVATVLAGALAEVARRPAAYEEVRREALAQIKRLLDGASGVAHRGATEVMARAAQAFEQVRPGLAPRPTSRPGTPASQPPAARPPQPSSRPEPRPGGAQVGRGAADVAQRDRERQARRLEAAAEDYWRQRRHALAGGTTDAELRTRIARQHGLSRAALDAALGPVADARASAGPGGVRASAAGGAGASGTPRGSPEPEGRQAALETLIRKATCGLRYGGRDADFHLSPQVEALIYHTVQALLSGAGPVLPAMMPAEVAEHTLRLHAYEIAKQVAVRGSAGARAQQARHDVQRLREAAHGGSLWARAARDVTVALVLASRIANGQVPLVLPIATQLEAHSPEKLVEMLRKSVARQRNGQDYETVVVEGQRIDRRVLSPAELSALQAGTAWRTLNQQMGPQLARLAPAELARWVRVAYDELRKVTDPDTLVRIASGHAGRAFYARFLADVRSRIDTHWN